MAKLSSDHSETVHLSYIQWLGSFFFHLPTARPARAVNSASPHFSPIPTTAFLMPIDRMLLLPIHSPRRHHPAAPLLVVSLLPACDYRILPPRHVCNFQSPSDLPLRRVPNSRPPSNRTICFALRPAAVRSAFTTSHHPPTRTFGVRSSTNHRRSRLNQAFKATLSGFSTQFGITSDLVSEVLVLVFLGYKCSFLCFHVTYSM
jgi:hypothetical protein